MITDASNSLEFLRTLSKRPPPPAGNLSRCQQEIASSRTRSLPGGDRKHCVQVTV